LAAVCVTASQLLRTEARPGYGKNCPGEKLKGSENLDDLEKLKV